MREIDLKQANYFHKDFLQILTYIRGSRSSHILVFFHQNAITETKQVKPLTLMVSTKSAHLLPENSLDAFNGFYCTWKPVTFRWKHFTWPSMNCRSLKTARNLRINITKNVIKKRHALFHSQWKGITFSLFNNSRRIS